VQFVCDHNGHEYELVEIGLFHIEGVLHDDLFEQDETIDVDGVFSDQTFADALQVVRHLERGALARVKERFFNEVFPGGVARNLVSICTISTR